MAKGMIAQPNKKKLEQEKPADPNFLSVEVNCPGCGYKNNIKATLIEKVTVVKYDCEHCSNTNTYTISRG